MSGSFVFWMSFGLMVILLRWSWGLFCGFGLVGIDFWIDRDNNFSSEISRFDTDS